MLTGARMLTWAWRGPARKLAQWRARDPVSRLRQALELAGQWSEPEDEALAKELNEEIADAWRQAMRDPLAACRSVVGSCVFSAGRCLMGAKVPYSYGTAIRAAFEYLLDKYPEVFVIGQGTLESVVRRRFDDRVGKKIWRSQSHRHAGV